MASSLTQLLPRKYRLAAKKLLGISYGKYNFKVELEKTDKPLHFHFVNIVGSHRASNLLEPSLAKFLVSRGHEVSVALCDKSLKGCLASSVWNNRNTDLDTFVGPQKIGLCNGCYSPSLQTWKSTGAKIFRLSQAVPSDNEKILNSFDDKILKYNGIDLSEDTIAGCLRYLCKGDEKYIDKQLWTAYSQSAIVTARFYENFFNQNSVDLCFSAHGIYVPHGVVNKMMQANKIEFYNYCTSYREKRFYFTRNDTYHKVLPNETSAELNLMNIKKQSVAETTEYLKSRSKGSQDWQQYNNNANENIDRYLKDNDIDIHKPTAVLFSNVVWDARLHFSDNTYPDMFEWVKDTVNYFKNCDDKNLIIRTHPGELISSSKSRERLRDYVQNLNITKNILFIDADDNISSYRLAEVSNLNLVYASKLAIELCLMDAPIITCGDAWIKNKGATITPTCKKNYLSLLETENWDDLNKFCNKDLGLAYADYIFNRKLLYFDYLVPTADRKSFKLDAERFKEAMVNYKNNDLSKIEQSRYEEL